MFALKPKEWAANRWSLYGKNRLYLLDSPSMVFSMRIVGALLAILSTSMLLGVMGRLFDSDTALTVSKWLLVPLGLSLLAWGPLAIVFGLRNVMCPSRSINPKTTENLVFLRAAVRLMGLLFAVLGCVVTARLFGWPIAGGTRAASIVLLVALGPILAYGFVNGVMYMWNPVGWSESRFSFVLPSDYRRYITSGSGMKVRAHGLLVMLVSAVILLSLLASSIWPKEREGPTSPVSPATTSSRRP